MAACLSSGPNPTTSLFEYPPIDLSISTFRLIRLFGADPWKQIQCELFEAWFNEEKGGMAYEALSYTWGGTEKQSHIIVNGKGMHVTKNLYEALFHLRHSDKDCYLWVDAICINQNNAQERGHQVCLMSTIYKEADRVLVWLGNGSNDTDDLLEFLNQQHTAITNGSETSLHSPHLSRQQSNGLVDLFRRPWFS